MIIDALEIEKYTYISVVGAGGKTSLIKELSITSPKEKIALTTTTHILKPEIYLDKITEEKVKAAFKTKTVMTFGEEEGIRLKSPSPDFFDYIEKYADLILIEADGAKELSFKAPNKNEPVIIEKNECTLMVFGISPLEKEIGKYCHRPEIIQEIAGSEKYLSIDTMAKVIIQMYIKKTLGDIRIIINQVDDKTCYKKAVKLAEIIENETNNKVVLTSLKKRMIVDASSY